VTRAARPPSGSPAAGYYKQCWCSTDIVSYAHKSNWLVHEFTADNHQHAALTDGRPKQVLPLGADGATTYNPAPNFTGPVNLTLASVGKGARALTQHKHRC
jgi:hypothetical protein